jgi:hypothetical protein
MARRVIKTGCFRKLWWDDWILRATKTSKNIDYCWEIQKTGCSIAESDDKKNAQNA